MKTAHRLDFIKDYYFAVKREEIRRLEKKGEPFILMAIGNPDLPPPPEVIHSLIAHLNDKGAHGYQPYGGLPSFKAAIAQFYRKRFGVELDPETQILPLMGSKSGIMWLSLAFTDPGDWILVPQPGYMAYASVARLVGANVEVLPLEAEKKWKPDWAKNSDKIRRAKIMWLNYTNMPTGEPASVEFLKETVAFLRDKDIILAFDNPYSLITRQPESVLKYAKNIYAVEFQSMSKNFNMAGWRIGWVAGHPEIIRQMAKVQSNIESGMFYPMQKAAETALDLADDWLEKINSIYDKRKRKVLELIQNFEGECNTEGGGMFCWVKLPEGMSGKRLADEWFYKYHIFIAPGTIFGPQWDQYVRISLTVSEAQYDEAIKRIRP